VDAQSEGGSAIFLLNFDDFKTIFAPFSWSQKQINANKCICILQGDGSFCMILSFHVILTDKAIIIQSIKS
jgi:hypothetical protein